MLGEPVNNYLIVLQPQTKLLYSTRQINNTGFDLILPGQSRTPLKPRKSGRVTKTPRVELAVQKSSRRTPKPAGTPTRTNKKKLQVVPPEPLKEANKNGLGALGSGSGQSPGIEATTKKRKLAGVGDARRAAKRPKTVTNIKEEKSVPMKRGRLMKAKPATSAGTHFHTRASNQPENLLDDELCSLLSPKNGPIDPVDAVSGPPQVQDKSNGVAIQRKTGKAAIEDPKPTQRKRITKAGIAKIAPAVEQDLVEPKAAIEKTETRAIPVPKRRRKKRRSIGQDTRKRQRPPMVVEENRLLHLKMSEPTSPRNDMLEAPSGSLKLHETQSEKEANLVQENISELAEIDAGLPETMDKAKSKPRKKRKPIAQMSRPRKVPKKDGNANASVLSVLVEDVSDKADGATSAETTQARQRARKPLADVTNFTPGLKVEKVELRQSDDEAPLSRPLKRKGHITAEPKQSQIHRDPLLDMVSALPVHKAKASRPPESQSLSNLKSTPTVAAKSTADNSVREQAPVKVRKLKPAKSAPKPTKPPSLQPGPTTSRSIKVEQTVDQQVLAKEDSHDIPRPPVKTRGQPRQTPGSETLPMTKSQPKKLKAPTRPRRQPANTIPVKTYRPIPSHDAGSDSDDPLSLSAPYPPKKAPKRG